MSWRNCFRLRPILHDPLVRLPPGIFDGLSVRESSAGFWPQGCVHGIVSVFASLAKIARFGLSGGGRCFLPRSSVLFHAEKRLRVEGRPAVPSNNRPPIGCLPTRSCLSPLHANCSSNADWASKVARKICIIVHLRRRRRNPSVQREFRPRIVPSMQGERQTPPLPNPRRSSAQRSPCRWAFLFGRSVEPLDRGRVSRVRLGKTPSLRRDRSPGAARSARAFGARETRSPGKALSARANSRSMTMFE